MIRLNSPAHSILVTLMLLELMQIKNGWAQNAEVRSGEISQSQDQGAALTSINIAGLRVIYQPDADPYYPSFSKRAGEKGDVVVRLIINEQGIVEEVRLLQSSSFPRLDRAAMEIGKRYIFTPYKINGIPTKISTNLLVKFNLRSPDEEEKNTSNLSKEKEGPAEITKASPLKVKDDDNRKLLLNDSNEIIEVPLLSSDIRQEKCKLDSGLVGNSQFTNEIVTESDDKKQKFYLDRSERLISGIRNVKIENNHLVINLPNKGYFPQFEAPSTVTIQKTNYEGKPGTAAMATVFTLGLNLFIAPKRTGHLLVGCTDEKTLKREIDLSQKKPTGTFDWLDRKNTNTVVLDGLDRTYSFDLSKNVNDSDSDDVRIDLRPLIDSTKLKGQIKLKINCKSCDPSDIDGQKKFFVYKTSADIDLDINQIKSSIAAEKARADKLARLKTASAAEREVDAKVDSGMSNINITPTYADLIIRKVKPFIFFNPQSTPGNPRTVVLVDVAPDGKILNRAIISASNDPLWDSAVLHAIDRTESMPRNENGVIPSRQFRLTFRPK